MITDERRTHKLKTWPENDRDYRIGDNLILQEWDPIKNEYTGSGLVVKVTYVLDDPDFVKDGYVVMGIKRWAVASHEANG